MVSVCQTTDQDHGKDAARWSIRTLLRAEMTFARRNSSNIATNASIVFKASPGRSAQQRPRNATKPHAAYLQRDRSTNATLDCNAPRKAVATHATVAGNAANAATQRPSFTQLETTPPDLCAAARIATKRDKFHETRLAVARSNDAPTWTHVLKCPLSVLRLV